MRTRSGVVEGAVDVDGAVFTQRRGVTVPGGETATVALKISYESDDSFVTYSTTAWVE